MSKRAWWLLSSGKGNPEASPTVGLGKRLRLPGEEAGGATAGEPSRSGASSWWLWGGKQGLAVSAFQKDAMWGGPAGPQLSKPAGGGEGSGF